MNDDLIDTLALAMRAPSPLGDQYARQLATLMLAELCNQRPDVAAVLRGDAVAVPKVPTEEMIEAGWIDKEDTNPDDIYYAMLAASPFAKENAK